MRIPFWTARQEKKRQEEGNRIIAKQLKKAARARIIKVYREKARQWENGLRSDVEVHLPNAIKTYKAVGLVQTSDFGGHAKVWFKTAKIDHVLIQGVKVVVTETAHPYPRPEEPVELWQDDDDE